jgi:hypothetical protein
VLLSIKMDNNRYTEKNYNALSSWKGMGYNLRTLNYQPLVMIIELKFNSSSFIYFLSIMKTNYEVNRNKEMK